MFYKSSIFYNNTSTMQNRIGKIFNMQINARMKDCENALIKITDHKDKEFAEQLINYLKNRRTKHYIFSDNLPVINERSIFTLKIVNALVVQNKTRVASLLQDSRINTFRGFFSQVFYNLLTAYRSKELHIEPASPRRWFGCLC